MGRVRGWVTAGRTGGGRVATGPAVARLTGRGHVAAGAVLSGMAARLTSLPVRVLGRVRVRHVLPFVAGVGPPADSVGLFQQPDTHRVAVPLSLVRVDGAEDAEDDREDPDQGDQRRTDPGEGMEEDTQPDEGNAGENIRNQ